MKRIFSVESEDKINAKTVEKALNFYIYADEKVKHIKVKRIPFHPHTVANLQRVGK